jgi:hypothetical protein
MITYLELGVTDGVSVSLVSINIWRLDGNNLNIACTLLYCNHQMHRDFLIILYLSHTVYTISKQTSNKISAVLSSFILNMGEV